MTWLNKTKPVVNAPAVSLLSLNNQTLRMILYCKDFFVAV